MMDENPSDGMFPAWLLWVIAPVTVLAAALIVLALVLGIQAGQRQVEAQRRQQVGIAIQRAMDYRTEGMLEEALAEYQRVLVLDPGNTAAVTGIENLLELAAAGGVTLDPALQTLPNDATADYPPAVAGQVTSSPKLSQQSEPSIQATSTAPSAALSSQETLWEESRTATEAGEWQTAENALLQLKRTAPDFRTNEVNNALYNLYVNLAAEMDQQGDLERALGYVDQAIELHPDETALRDARDMAAKYLDVLTYTGVDWERTISLLEELYVRDADYRDVKARLREALLAYGDDLADDEQWCDAAENYRSAVAIEASPDTISQRDSLEERCQLVEDGGTDHSLDALGSLPQPTSDANRTDVIASDSSVSGTAEPDSAVDGAEDEPIATEPAPTVAASAPAAAISGRILYSATDPVSGRTNVFVKELGSNNPAILVVEDAEQAEYRPDEQRIVYRNMRGDMSGLTALDPASGLELRFTTFGEDARPSWNGEGNRITFASNREGDRLWRVYSLWADVGSEAVVLTYGDSPAWSRAEDKIAYRGCDPSGNQCGIWLMNGSGGDSRPLTTVPSDDRPDWSSDGSFVAFMSSARDGNPEVYRVGAGGGEVTRLTDNGAIDGLPVVSPDGSWVAFVSNRSGSWAVYAVPSGGGEPQALFTIAGSLDPWQDHNLQWLP